MHHIGFAPKNTNPLSLSSEAFIDTADFERAKVFARLMRRVPSVMRMALGTDISGFGYNIHRSVVAVLDSEFARCGVDGAPPDKK